MVDSPYFTVLDFHLSTHPKVSSPGRGDGEGSLVRATVHTDQGGMDGEKPILSFEALPIRGNKGERA